LKTQPAGAALARFYGIAMLTFSLFGVLFTRVPDNNIGKIVVAAAWLVFHTFAGICFTFPVIGRIGDNTTGAGIGHSLMAGLWAYYLFAHNLGAIDALKALVKSF